MFRRGNHDEEYPNLSGGQKHRVANQALINKKRLLFSEQKRSSGKKKGHEKKAFETHRKEGPLRKSQKEGGFE